MSEQGPLQFDPEAMRAIGHRTVDALGLDDGVRVPARREPDLVPGWATSPSVAAPDCFVILDGTFEVRDAGRALATLKAGELVGEIAALDWGGGYGAVRMAQVEAVTPATVLALTPEHLSEVLRRSPEALDLVERTARERLTALE